MITLITVTYNAIDTLERTLRSVERQTYRKVQHIIKDGGSKDGTVALAEAYQKRNPEADIIVVSERDKGLYDAMNTALGMATGDYVCFLNAGDKLHAPDTLQRLVEAIPEGVEWWKPYPRVWRQVWSMAILILSMMTAILSANVASHHQSAFVAAVSAMG